MRTYKRKYIQVRGNDAQQTEEEWDAIVSSEMLKQADKRYGYDCMIV